MGKLLKFNMYLDANKSKNSKIDMQEVKRSFKDYDKWLENTNKCDIMESFEMFLKISKQSLHSC